MIEYVKAEWQKQFRRFGMKLNYWRTICVGFAFFLICAFWQAYDNIIPKILMDLVMSSMDSVW